MKLVYVFLLEASSLTYAVIAPGFDALYLEATVKVFTQCLERSILKS
jgi:predicted Rossmann fold nucleotide-binding protein DprA/Smf involved in DNA uptake